MSIKTILVHVADDDQYKKRLRMALALAKRNKAHITALYVTRPTDFRSAAIGRAASSSFIDSAIEVSRKKAAELEIDFAATCEEKKISHRWVVEDGDHLNMLEEHARAADLVIVSQSKNKYLEDFFRHQLPEQIVMLSGCPVLVLPRKWRVKTTIDSVLVPWKSEREAVRAVRDSLVFLKKAKRIQVMTVGKSDAREGLPPDQLLMYLERHGVEAERHEVEASNVGAAIVAQAENMNHDMIVMGGFGQSRLQDLMLGSATNHIFRHMTIPVLMSH